MCSTKSKEEHGASQNSPMLSSMSTKTKILIQKICYKKTASIDMTKNGFAKYATKMHPVYLIIKPLREQLQKILGQHTDDRTTNPEKTRKLTSLRKNRGNEKGSTKSKTRKLANKKKESKEKHKTMKNLHSKL